MNENYRIHVKCANCGYKSVHPEQMVEIQKGIEIYKKLLETPCPHCGCKSLNEIRY